MLTSCLGYQADELNHVLYIIFNRLFVWDMFAMYCYKYNMTNIVLVLCELIETQGLKLSEVVTEGLVWCTGQVHTEIII